MNLSPDRNYDLKQQQTSWIDAISKRQEIVSENKHVHAVVLLPAKKAEAIDLSDVEAEVVRR